MLPILDIQSVTIMTTPKSTPVRRPPSAHDNHHQHNRPKHGDGGGLGTRLSRFLSQRRVANAPQGPLSDDDLAPGYGYDLHYGGDAWGYYSEPAAHLSQESLLPPYFHMDRFVAHEPTELIISKHRLGTHIVIEARTSVGLREKMFETEVEFFLPSSFVGPDRSSIKLRLLDALHEPVLNLVQASDDRRHFCAQHPATNTPMMRIQSDRRRGRTEICFPRGEPGGPGGPDLRAFWDARTRSRHVLALDSTGYTQVGTIGCVQGTLQRKVHVQVAPGQSCLLLAAIALSLFETEYVLGVAVAL